jgi:hypothetical protein
MLAWSSMRWERILSRSRSLMAKWPPVARWRAYLTLPKLPSPRVRPTSYLPSSDARVHCSSDSPPFTIHNPKPTPLLIGNGLPRWRDPILVVGTDEERERGAGTFILLRSVLLCSWMRLSCLLLPLFVYLRFPHPLVFRNKLTHTQNNAMPLTSSSWRKNTA